ncbi:MAG TPA: serine/threonine-protein kinase PknK, partial [Pseudomonadota bacterium]|nr:serine/threonine-protein kinase PknK [Pseudomonadota bacterium]
MYRATRRTNGERVLIKRLQAQYPTPAQIARFDREFAILRRLAGPGIPTALELETSIHSRYIVFADEGAESLARLPMPLPLEQFFALARELATILGRVHAAGMLHKDITPANVVCHPIRQLVQLIDFGLAAELPREQHAANRPALLEGTLLYMSPEQTGRMNRGVDYRADYYGLGATLYHALTGHPPFASDDPLELVHCHIARLPKLACEHRPEVPRCLSRVLHKLLAKTPEERYQSSAGLLADLTRCQTAAERGIDEPFELGSADVSEQFIVSEVLYGRQEQVRTLLDAFDRAAEGRTEVLLLPGAPGIGKSALISEVQRPIVGCRGLFAAGKFDQYSRGIPFAAVLQAFRGLLRQLLTEEEAQLRGYREAFDAALGVNVSVLVDVLPELALHTGRRPPAPELPPSEAQVRFELTFQNFVGVLAKKEHPLVLVLDDLQWADQSSLSLLTHLCTRPGSGHFLVMGAFRDGEVGAQHPLQIAMRELAARGVQMTNLPIGPLAELDVQALVAASLRAPAAEVADFAQVLFERTAGNPFFVTQILRKLHRDQVITFNQTARCFQVPGQALALLPAADNVADLMSAAILGLAPPTQRALRLAACIGNELDLATLAAVSGASRKSTAEALWPALQAGLVIPLSGAYRTVSDADDTVVRYRFVHDRVQQAAYATLGPDELAPTHHAIGERLLAELSGEEREQRLFEIVTHLNKGAALRTDQADRDKLADWNLRAARRAMAATAFASAWELLRTALELRGPARFGRDYQASLELDTTAAEAAVYAGDMGAMEALLDGVERDARTLLDKVRAREIRIQAYIVKSRGEEALRVALGHLADLGEPVSRNPTRAELLLEVARFRLALGRKTPEQMLSLAKIDDPIKHAAMRAIGFIHSYSYEVCPDLTAVVGFRLLTLSLRHGVAPATPVALAGYGGFVSDTVGDIPLGVRIGRVALTLAERPECLPFRSRTHFTAAWLSEAWVRPFRETGELALKGWSSALDSGDLHGAQTSAVIRMTYNLWGNRPIEESLSEGRGFDQLLKSSGGPRLAEICLIMNQVLAKLLDPGPDITQLTGEFLDQEQYLAIAREKDPKALVAFCLLRSWLLYLEDRCDAARIQLEDARPVLFCVTYSWMIPVWHARCAMLDATRLGKLSRFQQMQAEHRIARSLRTLRRLARHNPESFQFRIALIEAERAASRGRDGDAIAAFDQAIQQANAARLPGEAALAGERAAYFYRSRGRTTVARSYLQDACGAWTAWGAHGRVRTLQQRFPDLVDSTQSDGLSVRQSSQGVAGAVLTQAFDATAVIQAAQAIADQTDIPMLLDRVMTLTLEHAGARRGSLVLSRAGALRIKAFADVAADGFLRVLDQPLGDGSSAGEPLPAALARYALRTHEPVVLDDAQAVGGPFAQDAWVRA